MREIKSNDFRNYTIGDIEKICEKQTHCDECVAKIICSSLSNLTISWEYTTKYIEQRLKREKE